jgi:hypothetical protein
LQDDVVVILPGREGASQNLVAVHLYNTIANSVVVAALDSVEKFYCNPFLLALHERSHHLSNPFFVERPRLEVVDILLIILTCLLFARLFSNWRVPTIAIINTQSLNSPMRQLGCPSTLRLPTNVSRTIWLATVASLWISTITINIVVENQLLARFDVPLGKNAHAQLFSHHPFVHIAVWVAGVITEPAEVPFPCRINKLGFIEGHEIEMLDALLVILNGSPTERWLVDNFANILENEVVSTQINIGSQSVALFLSFDYGYVGVLFALEALILTSPATRAISVDAFQFSRTINTIRIFSACLILAIDWGISFSTQFAQLGWERVLLRSSEQSQSMGPSSSSDILDLPIDFDP